jgi:hypothetical protein
MAVSNAHRGLAAPRPSALPALGLRVLMGFLLAVRATYFLLMWLVTAYEAANIVGLPLVFHLASLGALRPEAADAMYLSASLGHVYLLPAVSWFLVYQGLPSLARR